MFSSACSVPTRNVLTKGHANNNLCPHPPSQTLPALLRGDVVLTEMCMYMPNRNTASMVVQCLYLGVYQEGLSVRL